MTTILVEMLAGLSLEVYSVHGSRGAGSGSVELSSECACVGGRGGGKLHSFVCLCACVRVLYFMNAVAYSIEAIHKHTRAAVAEPTRYPLHGVVLLDWHEGVASRDVVRV